MKENKCGDRNMHWYHSGDTCGCGQIPKEIFFGTPCDCGEGQLKKPIHYPDCASVAFVDKHNEWVRNHPELDPPVQLLTIAYTRFADEQRGVKN
ncbi:hypothetical protein LCGC14_2621630 [marine sediment metagenome]|uniref:Uncharacterized protein n=1 Tax=marine sediment metagenome TaxID=412755 RepID=A0A0F9A323_9ZZZZ